MVDDKYTRKPVVFHKFSDRDMRIWNWIIGRTNNFEKQNFAAFVRDKLEWCMMNEGKEVQKADPVEEQPQSKGGWSSLL